MRPTDTPAEAVLESRPLPHGHDDPTSPYWLKPGQREAYQETPISAWLLAEALDLVRSEHAAAGRTSTAIEQIQAAEFQAVTATMHSR